MRLLAALLMAPLLASAQTPDFSPVTTRMQSLVSTANLPGASVIVIRDGQVLYEQAFGGYGLQQRVAIASATKWLSGAVIARLVDRRVLRWDDSIGQYLPNAPADKRAITLRQLFSHSSGLPAGEVACIGEANLVFQNCVDQILSVPLSYAPGTRFAYGGNSMHVAGRLAEIATGLRWDQIFRNEIATPLGMSETDYGFNSVAPGTIEVSNPRIAGGARSTLRDYARLAQAFVQRGQFGGQTWLSAGLVEQLIEDQTRGAPVLSSPLETSIGYGIGLWREQVDSAGRATMLSSPGAFGFYPVFDREAGFAGVFLTQNLLRNVEAPVRAMWSDVRTILGPAAPATVAAGGYRVAASGVLPVETYAEAPGSTRIFERWTGDAATLSDPRAWHASFAQPANAVALAARFQSVPALPTIATSSINGSRYRQAIPPNPRGLIFSFHGSGGSGDLPFQKPQAIEATTLFLARGFGVVGLDSVNRDDRQWNPQFSTSNPDVVNVQGIIDRLRAAGTIGPATPIFCEGTSNGGGFCSRISALLNFAGQSLMIADGVDAVMAQTAVPTIWTLGRNDPTLASGYLTRAQNSSAGMSLRGVPNELSIVEPNPVYPERFARIDGISLADSRSLTDALRQGGFLDARGMVIRDPRGGAIDALIPASLRSLRGDITGQIESAFGAHEYHSDYIHRTAHFFEAQLKRNLTGLYFKPDEPGWGLSLAHQGDSLFPTWYTYDAQGRAIWYLGGALTLQSDGRYTGTAFRVTGTPFSEIVGDAGAQATPVGEFALRPLPAGAIEFGYSIAGVSQQKRVEPFRFGRLPSCRFTAGDRAGGANRSDIWWNPRQSGWGLSLIEQGSTLAVAWYTYGADRQPIWLVATLVRDASGRFSGSLRRPTTGTPFAQINAAPAAGELPIVGDASVEFVDGQRGVFRYRLDGVSQSRDIERFVYSGPGLSDCQ
jgi:CubicO group peptidase (beta-lactamase class C family)